MARRSGGVFLTLALGACTATRPLGRVAEAGAAPGPIDPAGLDGEEILGRVCTECHDLGGLPAFADYWGEPEWRSLMDTMIGYGAELSDDEYAALARYLGERYTPDSR